MPYAQVTLADLLVALADRYESKPFWSSTEATRALNEGLRIWNAATGFWMGKRYVTTVPNDPYLPLDGTLTQTTRVLWNAIPLEKTSRYDLDYGIPNWRGATTVTPGAPPRPSYWAPLGLSLICIYPADAVGLNTLEVAGVRTTPILVNPTDYVDLGQEEHDQLLAYAHHVLAFKIGGEVLVASYAGWLGFLKAAGARNQRFAASAFYRRALGMDQQRRLRPTTAPVTTPVDQALQAGQATLS
jgi:hypothetical protein